MHLSTSYLLVRVSTYRNDIRRVVGGLQFPSATVSGPEMLTLQWLMHGLLYGLVHIIKSLILHELPQIFSDYFIPTNLIFSKVLSLELGHKKKKPSFLRNATQKSLHFALSGQILLWVDSLTPWPDFLFSRGFLVWIIFANALASKGALVLFDTLCQVLTKPFIRALLKWLNEGKYP